MFSLCFLCLYFNRLKSLFLFHKNDTMIFKNPFFHNPMSAPPTHIHTPVRILLNVRYAMAKWSLTGQTAIVRKMQKQKTLWGDFFFFFFFFLIFQFIDLGQFWNVYYQCSQKLLWKNGKDIYQSGSECWRQSFSRFCFTHFSLIYFPDNYINAKYITTSILTYPQFCLVLPCHLTNRFSYIIPFYIFPY